MLFGPVSHKHWHKLQTPNRTSNPWRHSGHLKIKTVLFIIHFYKMFWNLKKKNDFENGTVCQLNVFYIKLFCFSSDFIETWWSCSTHDVTYYSITKLYQILMKNKKVLYKTHLTDGSSEITSVTAADNSHLPEFYDSYRGCC